MLRRIRRIGGDASSLKPLRVLALDARPADGKCSLPFCDRRHAGATYCAVHLRHFRRHGDRSKLKPIGKPGRHHDHPLPTRTCAYDGCDRPTRGSMHEHCRTHVAQLERHGGDRSKLKPIQLQRRGQAIESQPCSFGGCANRTTSPREHPLCPAHQKQLRNASGDRSKLQPLRPRGTPPPDRKCTYPGCDRDFSGLGLCVQHRRQLKIAGGDRSKLEPIGPRIRGTCTFRGCNRPNQAHGWCKGHYAQWRKRDKDVSRMRPLFTRREKAELNDAHDRISELKRENESLRATIKHREAEWAQATATASTAAQAQERESERERAGTNGTGRESGSVDDTARVRELLAIVDLQREGFLNLEERLKRARIKVPEAERAVDQRAEAVLESYGY